MQKQGISIVHNRKWRSRFLVVTMRSYSVVLRILLVVLPGSSRGIGTGAGVYRSTRCSRHRAINFNWDASIRADSGKVNNLTWSKNFDNEKLKRAIPQIDNYYVGGFHPNSYGLKHNVF